MSTADLLDSAAALDGDRFERFVSDLLGVRAGRVAPRLGPDESALVARINAGPSPNFWARYRELIDRRDARSLTPGQHAELIRLGDGVEEYQADRAAALALLAAARGQTLAELAAALGLTAPSRTIWHSPTRAAIIPSPAESKSLIEIQGNP